MNIFCSTGGSKNRTFQESAEAYMSLGIKNIELSAGLRTDFKESTLINFANQANIMIHNYFPPREDGIVLNLASLNDDIFNKSLMFYKESIRLSALVGSRYFGLHSGFLIDPPESALGGVIPRVKLFDRQESISRLKSGLLELSGFASRFGVKVLAENNVSSLANLKSHGSNIVLLADPIEIVEFLMDLNNSVGLLLDVGHLKVSANTLNFNLTESFSRLGPFISGYHLSDNGGESDDHLPFGPDAWFLPFLRHDVDFATIEVDNLSDLAMREIYSSLIELTRG
jgi:sugar phosphate isomerase/epimerase